MCCLGGGVSPFKWRWSPKEAVMAQHQTNSDPLSTTLGTVSPDIWTSWMKQNKAHFGFSGFIRKNGISNLLFDDSNDDEDDDVNDDYLRLLTAHPPPPSALSRRILHSSDGKASSLCCCSQWVLFSSVSHCNTMLVLHYIHYTAQMGKPRFVVRLKWVLFWIVMLYIIDKHQNIYGKILLALWS